MAPNEALNADEAERLLEVQRYRVMDTPAEPAFDDLVLIASTLCDTPIALLGLMDDHRQWFKARLGTELVELPREESFCVYTVTGAAPFVVEDLAADPRFAGTSLVTGPAALRFYAGVPLFSPRGHALGTLSVLDRRPRRLQPAQLAALEALGRQVLGQLEVRRQFHELNATVAQRNADLAALHALQTALAEREQRLARIAAQLPGVVYQFRLFPDGRSCFGYASEGIRDIYRVAPEDVRDDATPVFEILHPEDLPRVAETIAASATALTLWDCEYRVRHHDGTVRWLHGRSQPERLADGSTQWHGFITDITPRKEAERGLRERDALLQQAQRLARMGSWRWDRRSGLNQWSDATWRLFGLEPDGAGIDAAGFLARVHPDDRAGLLEAHDAALAGLRPYDVRYRALLPDGSLRHMHGRAEVVTGDEDEALTMVGAVIDISESVANQQALARHRDELEQLVEARTHELIAARDAAELASRAKSDFLSSMSHELRTPMNAILGFSQLLQLERQLGERPAAFVAEILRAGHHLLQLINEVLDLARVESGRLTLSPEPLRLSELAGEALTLVQPLAAQRRVRLDAGALGDTVVHADRLRLKQVLLNLLSNAVKYNRDGGEVRLQAQTIDGRVRVSVHDTGIGIAPEQISQLFQPFSRLGSDRGSGDGTGIGLSISQRLLQLMGGRIGLNSTPGVGSEFWVELPSGHLADPPAPRNDHPTAALAQPPDRAAVPPPRAARVLYIEDNPANLKLVEQIVRRHPGLELLPAPSGGLGLELARAHRPDLVLLDIHLPDMDGYAVLAQLRADPSTRRIPVVAVTAQAMPDDVKRVRAAGFDGYLAKPLDLATVDALLEPVGTAPRPAG